MEITIRVIALCTIEPREDDLAIKLDPYIKSLYGKVTFVNKFSSSSSDNKNGSV